LFGENYKLHGVGNGRLDAVRNALNNSPYTFDYDFVTYSEHALESDSNSRAAAYVAIADKEENIFWGVGLHEDIIFASINALVSAINRMTEKHTLQEEK
jgi:2-isopropylmalate synthase